MVEAKQLLDFIPAVQSLAGIKSDTLKLKGINRLAAAERGVDINKLNLTTFAAIGNVTYCCNPKFIFKEELKLCLNPKKYLRQ